MVITPHLSSVVHCQATPLYDLSSETSGPRFFKLHVAPSVKGGFKICAKVTVLSKMATMPLYGKHLKIFFRTKKALRLILGSIIASGTQDLPNYFK